MKLNDIKSAYFIGIGGAGMAGVAEIFHKNYIQVLGSDIVASNSINRLKKMGINIFLEQNANNISKNYSVIVIAGKAIKFDNPELKEAKKQNIKIIERSDALAMLIDGKKTIAVTGSHGKTTVSAMIAQSLLDNGFDISFIIGAELVKYKTGAYFGKSDIFVIEADESDASFLKYKPYISVINNIEPDHLDYYKSVENYNKTFADYIKLTQYKLFINQKNRKFIPNNNRFNIEFFIESNNYFSTNESIALAVLHEFNISHISFSGVKRRFEYKGTKRGISVYDDYAHHPSEITQLISLAREKFPMSKINIVFEPHLFSRTKNFANEFSNALAKADAVALVDIYPAREKSIKNVTSKLIKSGKYFNKWANAIDFIVSKSKKGDVIFTVGAGTITKMGDLILKAIKNRTKC